MSDDITNQILKLIEPVFQPGYTGDGIDVCRIMSAMRRLSKISFMQEVCDWHIECEKVGWRSQATIKIEYHDDRPFIPDTVSCLLDEGEKALAEQAMEMIDNHGSIEPKIEDFIDRVVQIENEASWSANGWRERLLPLAGMAGFDLMAHYSAKMAEDLQDVVNDAPQASKPGARM